MTIQRCFGDLTLCVSHSIFSLGLRLQSRGYLLAKRTRERGLEFLELLHLYCEEGERPGSSFSRKHPPTTPKTISRPRRGGGGSSSSSTPEAAAGVAQQSAPVNIPYWSKLQMQKSKKAPNSKSARDSDEEDGAESSDGGAVDRERGESEEDEDEGYCRMPPHELIAMRLARSHISSFSVFEGAGRTLKGRDLSKVRNAVLTRTGFLESP